jgi:segregation and condensation protein B
MSLKAKLEAVIYAAEEPVTPAQLTALFGGEALDWKRERESAAAANSEQPVAPEAAEKAGLPVDEAFGLLDLGEPAVEPGARPVGASGGAAGTEGAGEANGERAETGSEDAAEATTEPGVGDEAAEAKREARLREREARAVIRQLLDELIAEYAADSSGIEIREIAGGYRMATKPEFHEVVRSFVKSLKAPLKLSLPALETLAVIAYKQPVTAPEVNDIRGVDSSAVFGSLLARKLIATAGRKPVVGRPILYKTTKEFLLRFGLKDVSELPSMEEFEKLAVSELEADEAQAEAPVNGADEEFNPDPSVERDEDEASAPGAAERGELESNLSGPTDDSASAPGGAE